MNITDPKYLKQLRDLPSGYLLDLLVDCESIDHPSIYWVLEERGVTREEIDQARKRRSNRKWPRPHKLWAIARWATLVNTLIVTCFNLITLYRLLHTDHPFRGPILFLTIGCIGIGFVVGYKMTTQLYQGDKSTLYCGFPVPVGYINLENGEEIRLERPTVLLRISLNALAGVSLALFPLMFLYTMLD